MMMWMWISAIVILFGAQLNSEIEHQTARDCGQRLRIGRLAPRLPAAWTVPVQYGKTENYYQHASRSCCFRPWSCIVSPGV